MGLVVVPRNESLRVSSNAAAAPTERLPEHVQPGDYVWAFVADSYSPVLTGRYELVEITSEPRTLELPSVMAHWFTKTDPVSTRVPVDWRCVSLDGQIGDLHQERQSAVAHPSVVYDHIPTALDMELFSNGFSSPQLTEAAAYFLGAFAVRPQCYSVGGDTWGVFSVYINRSGGYGASRPKHILANWLNAHCEAILTLAESIWDSSDFFVEQFGSSIGLSDIAARSGHRSDVNMKSRPVLAGFAVHGKIGAQVEMDSDLAPKGEGFQRIQYWYSFLPSVLLERSSASVQKAFLLGAFDTISNADKNRRSLGLDWLDGYVGEFPSYRALHSVGRANLESYDVSETGNPRFTDERTRGRISRCKIWDYVRNVGFISPQRFSRALSYDRSSAGITLAQFPKSNVLSVALGVQVQSLAIRSDYGSSERDLRERSLFFDLDSKEDSDFVEFNLSYASSFPASSLPIGHRHSSTPAPPVLLSGSSIQLDRLNWESDALEKIRTMSDLLRSTPSRGAVASDRIFEYVVALLLSTLPGCREAWVIPRHEDTGIDIGASFHTGLDSFGSLNLIVQAKLQAGPVGRRVVDQVRGSLHREQGLLGYVATNSNFTQPARRSAELDHPPVRLINGQELVRMLLKQKVGLMHKGRAARRSVLLNMDFFECLRSIIWDTRSHRGKIRVRMNEKTLPEAWE